MMRVVTIDGPAGAGKSTLSRRLAERLGCRLLDTGAMYRAVTLAALRCGLDPADQEQLDALVRKVKVGFFDGAVQLDGEDVTSAIRTVEVTEASRHAANNPSVRAQLVEWQRRFALENVVTGIVSEGRDQGTIVFPDAAVKFFLTASLEERAHRRYMELRDRGEVVELEEIRQAMSDRDQRDTERAIAPLKAAQDAIAIDSTNRGIPELTELLYSIAHPKLPTISPREEK